MQHEFIFALSVLAFSAVGIEVKAQAAAQAGETTNAPVTLTTKDQLGELADSLFRSTAGDGIELLLSSEFITKPGENPVTVYHPEIELWVAKPINLTRRSRNQEFG